MKSELKDVEKAGLQRLRICHTIAGVDKPAALIQQSADHIEQNTKCYSWGAVDC